MFPAVSQESDLTPISMSHRRPFVRTILTVYCLLFTLHFAARADPPRNYTSQVPKFTFAEDLPTQESQLKENPLIQRFRQGRRKLAADPFTPAYHFSSPEAQLNDPNGLCFWQNRWHLFYQANPPDDHRWHWAH